MQSLRRTIQMTFICLLFTLHVGTHAIGLGVAPDWNQLSPDQQKVLLKYKDDWKSLPSDRRDQLSNASVSGWRSPRQTGPD